MQIDARTLPPAPERPASSRRLMLLDVARGAALVAMFVYHFTWDLRFFGLTDADVIGDPRWRWFARGIAATFLFLVGIGLVLAHGDGLRQGPFLRRLALIAGAAALVTVGTYAAMPDGTIWFGILHAIAASSVLALPFLGAPLPLVGAVAGLVFAAPSLLAADLFNAAIFYPLGLRTIEPSTNDYVPLLPWFGCVLAGILVARVARHGLIRLMGTDVPPLRPLAFMGRHSLVVYLLHQPVFLGALWLFTAMTAGSPAASDIAEFRQACRNQCLVAGSGRPVCETYCGCAEDELKEAGLWADAVANRLKPASDETVSTIIAICRRRAAPGAPPASN